MDSYSTNTPLSGNETTKIILFFILITIASLFLAGIPILLLSIIGLIAMKLSSDFSAMKTSISLIKYYLYCCLPFAGICIATLILYNIYGQFESYSANFNSCLSNPNSITDPSYTSYCQLYSKKHTLSSYFKKELLEGDAIGVTISIIIAYLASIVFINILFIKPLLNHKDWIAKNGLFSKHQKSTNSLNVIGTDKLKSYSVADELNKWSDLRERGLINENEFQEIKKKLLNQ